MPNEREMKTMQEAHLYDIVLMIELKGHESREVMLQNMFLKAQSGMTAEEIDAVKQRVSMMKKNME
jgi:hypothetical protein